MAPRCPQQRQPQEGRQKTSANNYRPWAGPTTEQIRSNVGSPDPLTDRRPNPARDPYGHPSEGTTTLSVRVPTVSLHIHGRCAPNAFVSRSSQLPTRTQVVYRVCDSESHMHLRPVSQGFAADGLLPRWARTQETELHRYMSATILYCCCASSVTTTTRLECKAASPLMLCPASRTLASWPPASRTLAS